MAADPSGANCPDTGAAAIPLTGDMPLVGAPPAPSIIRCASTFAVAVAPGAIVMTGRETLTVTAELPAPNDGGTEDSAVPQTLFGWAESANFRSPPVWMIDSGREV